MKKLITLCLLIVSIITSVIFVPVTYAAEPMQGTIITEENTGNMNRVPVNSDVLWPLSGGPWGRFLVADYNHDGYLDLQVSGVGIGETGTWRFYGTADSQNPESPNYLVMEGRRKIADSYWTEYTPRCLYDDQGNYLSTAIASEFAYDYDLATSGGTIGIDLSQFNNPLYINGDKVIDARTTENPGARLSSAFHVLVVDFDGDGADDIVYALNEYGQDLSEHGTYKIPNFSNDGYWGDDNKDGVLDERDPDTDTNGDGYIDENDEWIGDGDDDPMHGYILWVKNEGTNTSPRYTQGPTTVQMWDHTTDAQGNKEKVDGSSMAFDSFLGYPCPAIEDFDNDGDLDIMGTGFPGIIHYYENIGTSTEPIYIKAQRLKSANGLDVVSPNGQAALFNVDWNNDGLMDIFIYSGEEGCVYLSEHTGKYSDSGMPIFTQPKPFMCPADNLKVPTFGRASSADWDYDGDEDLIIGEEGGHIYFVRNTTIEKAREINPTIAIEDIDLTNPSWDTPYNLRTPDDKKFIFKAGYKGNPLQGSENICGPQGPMELNFGYIVPTVADWDMDGTLDIVFNDIYGRIRYLKGIPGDPYHVGYPEKIKVEWTGNTPKPAWNNWWDPEEGDLVTIWRTEPVVIDLPLDEDGDGVAEGDGLLDLIIIDHEGAFSFFKRYRDRDGSLKLKEGKRIFKLNGSPWSPTSLGTDHGKEGWRMIDWDGDGKLDILRQGRWKEGAIQFHKNISEKDGEYNFASGVELSPDRILRQHEVGLTFCDWNKDGIPDLLVTPECGNVYYLINKQWQNQ